MAIGAVRGDALVQFVVLVLPDRHDWLRQGQIVLVFAGQVAGGVVEPLEPAGGVLGEDEAAVAVVGVALCLRLDANLR
ncbi:hypothetical protein D3C72_2145610 [compost metagenome]